MVKVMVSRRGWLLVVVVLGWLVAAPGVAVAVKRPDPIPLGHVPARAA